MVSADWVEPHIWYERLPTTHIAALALLRDERGRALLVKPHYRTDWTLPGGMVEAGETPDEAVIREVSEELGIEALSYRLVAVDWSPPQGDRRRPIIAFVFSGGIINDQNFTLQQSELDDWTFASAKDAESLMPANAANRVRAAINACQEQSAIYLVQGQANDTGKYFNISAPKTM
jgi:8-oxo-dGTP diphosphatase